MSAVEVVLHAGTWRIEAPLRFGPADGGRDGKRVTWRADGDVTISGGRAITGFVVQPDGTWTVTVGPAWQFRELFVNGSRRPRARHPDDGFLRVQKPAADRRTGFTFEPETLASIDGLDAVELVFLHDWSITRVGIAAIDATNATVKTKDPIGGNAPHYAIDAFEPHPRYFVENARAYLDRPGEWFHDPATGVLSYLPLPGEEPDQVEVIAPFATGLLDVRGDASEPVRALHFDGIAFAHCAWSIPAHGYAEGQATWHEPRTAQSGILSTIVPAALRFEHAVGCEVRNASIAHLGTGGVWFGPRCSDCTLAQSKVDDVSGNGVMIGEDQTRHVDGEVWWRKAPQHLASGNTVSHCVITRCGQQFFGAVGIWVGFARGTRIVGNELHGLPYTGVSLGWIWDASPTPCGDHLVTDNHIHHVMQVLSDGGGIYTLGRQPGTVLARNRIHDIPVNLGRAESNGMFLDEGSTGLVIEDNQIWNLDRSPLRFHRATTNLVRGNLLVVRGETPPIRFNSTEPTAIELRDNLVAREVGDGR